VKKKMKNAGPISPYMEKMAKDKPPVPKGKKKGKK
jgi:hypothetical protein